MPRRQLGAFAQRNLDLAARSGATALIAAEPQVFEALQARIDALLEHSSAPIRILNAGCGGGGRYVPVAERRVVVGIDIEPDAGRPPNHIDERLVGNLETYDFGSRRFDVVYSWDVLEHVRDPRRALLNLICTLEPGGLVVLGLPHASSVKALLTRLVPFWVHRWLWRRVFLRYHESATVEATKPFPTVLSRAMAPSALQRFARDHRLSVEFISEYESWTQKKVRMMLRLTGRTFRALSWIVDLISLGRLTASATDVVIVLRKPLSTSQPAQWQEAGPPA